LKSKVTNLLRPFAKIVDSKAARRGMIIGIKGGKGNDNGLHKKKSPPIRYCPVRISPRIRMITAAMMEAFMV
jgi:hypothetical protein